ncbi:MAG: NERD domain-containing protein [Phycisphaeraceae bacterium]|nr:NERD domain-containing protein [Phycisphaeraceae bacterium]
MSEADMIIKERESAYAGSDPRKIAGDNAESQMAFYLQRAFGQSEDVYVLNNLRLVDPDRRTFEGDEDRCQIDHLVIHQWGMFIIESKSISTAVRVGDHGAGDEWSIFWNNTYTGMASPIQQAARQGDYLRQLLQAHKSELLDKVAVGFRTLSRMFNGTDQRGFKFLPMQIIVAISDHGTIDRVHNWKPPSKPFRSVVCKADQVTSFIENEIRTHRVSKGTRRGDYGLWKMRREELDVVARFLVSRHVPQAHMNRRVGISASRPPHGKLMPESDPTQSHSAATNASGRVPPQSDATFALPPRCKECGSARLQGSSGRFGPYWLCEDCRTNTAMPVVCSTCHARGSKGKGVRIRRRVSSFIRECDHCGSQEIIWTNA